MTQTDKYAIPIDFAESEFDRHINTDGNSRIFFSGRYGIGKSYFLRRYFNELNSGKYNTVFVSPVNYAIGTNDDIFDIIKVDIITKIFTKDLIDLIKKDDFSDNEYLKNFLHFNPDLVISEMISLASLISEEASIIKKLLTSISSMQKEFKAWKKKIKEGEKSDTQLLIDTVQNTHKNLEGYFGLTQINGVIYSVLKSISVASKKQNILIIDDLDRLDPEHIFRILNVLSAHHDSDSGEHRFGFDKVIIVADVENVKKIFYHKYGDGVDFDGYMDKFYSLEIFHFNNRAAIHQYISHIIKPDRLSESGRLLLAELLIYMDDCGVVNLRKILKQRHFPDINNKWFVIDYLDLKKEVTPGTLRKIDFIDNLMTSELEIKSEDIELICIIKLLTLQLGSFQAMKEFFTDVINGKRFDSELSNIRNIVEPIIIARHAFGNGYKFFYAPKTFLSKLEGKYEGYFYEIHLSWDKRNKYDGTSGYYSKCKVELTRVNSDVTSKDLINQILSLISWVDSKFTSFFDQAL